MPHQGEACYARWVHQINSSSEVCSNVVSASDTCTVHSGLGFTKSSAMVFKCYGLPHRPELPPS